MRKKNLIPKSKAKTAYSLLSEVCAVIAAEPLRYDQWTWGRREGDMSPDDLTFHAYVFPACGTVGCVAGWVATLKSKRDFDMNNAGTIARRILGLGGKDAGELFSPEAARGASQSTAHAAAGVKHIRRFQKKHRAQLLAKKV